MNNELYHYGIKGQKWGVRRFQNKDGSLTAKGKKRYAKELRTQLQTSGAEGKQWYEMSDDLARSDKFKSALGNKIHDIIKAKDEYVRLSNELDRSYRNQSNKLTEKKLNSLVDQEIKNNKDFYQSWKPTRFFDKDGNPTDELKWYVKDAIQDEYASRNKQHQEIQKAYNQAWKKYDKLRTEAVNDLLGRHARDTVEVYDSLYGRTNNVRLDQIVQNAISGLHGNVEFDFYDD